MPFTTSLVGEHGDAPVSVVVYALSVALAGFANTGMAAYALRGRRLCGDDVDDDVIKYNIWRGLVVGLVFLVSLLLLPLGTSVVSLSWLSLILFQRIVRHRFSPPRRRVTRARRRRGAGAKFAQPRRRSPCKDCLSGPRAAGSGMNGGQRRGGTRDSHGETTDRAHRAGVPAAVSHGGAAGPAQAGHAGHPRDRRRALPERQGARPAGGGRGRRGPGDPDRQAAAGPGARGDGDGAAALRPRRPRRELRHRRRRRPHLLHDGRVRRRDHRLRDAASGASRPRPTWRTSAASRTRSPASRSGGRRSAPATAARPRSSTSSTPAGTTPSSTCRGW